MKYIDDSSGDSGSVKIKQNEEAPEVVTTIVNEEAGKDLENEAPKLNKKESMHLKKEEKERKKKELAEEKERLKREKQEEKIFTSTTSSSGFSTSFSSTDSVHVFISCISPDSVCVFISFICSGSVFVFFDGVPLITKCNNEILL
jgi:hypothetical protein